MFEDSKQLVESDLHAPTPVRQWIALVGLTISAAILLAIAPGALRPFVAMVAIAVLIASIGPSIGFHRHAAILVFVPVLGILAALTAVWRAVALPFNRYWPDRLWPFSNGGRLPNWQVVLAAGGFVLSAVTTIASLG